MKKYYSNGKLLLTGEYVILDGAKSLAVPTKYGQHLTISPVEQPELIWAGFTHQGNCWFEASFSLPKLRLISATFNSEKEGSSDQIAETLQNILQEARKLNPDFLMSNQGYFIKTALTFPQNWGLGSSSTLINNIASWACVNPFYLLRGAFSGSGYDIACAKNNTPVLYQLENKNPQIEKVIFSPVFKNQLYFVFLNKKQNSREGIAQYRKNNKGVLQEINKISNLSSAFLKSNSISELEDIITEHECIISSIIQMNPVKQCLFPDYSGAIKSLGAWGGDFILATGTNETPEYFKSKGYQTVIPYEEMVL